MVHLHDMFRFSVMIYFMDVIFSMSYGTDREIIFQLDVDIAYEGRIRLGRGISNRYLNV